PAARRLRPRAYGPRTRTAGAGLPGQRAGALDDPPPVAAGGRAADAAPSSFAAGSRTRYGAFRAGCRAAARRTAVARLVGRASPRARAHRPGNRATASRRHAAAAGAAGKPVRTAPAAHRLAPAGLAGLGAAQWH